MDTKRIKRSIFISAFVVIIAIGNYIRLPFKGGIRTIHELTLITIGFGLGVLLMNIVLYFRFKKNNDDPK
jgi:hypothetical protein